MVSINKQEFIALENRIPKVEAMQAIMNLQGRYMYYLQSHAYERIVALFAKTPGVSVEMDDLGKFVGYDKVAAVFLKVLKPLYMTKGALGLHMLTTPVIEIGEDQKTAWAMWHSFGCNTQPDMVSARSDSGLVAMWQQGKYYMDFIKEDGIWKYLHFRWYTNFRTPFDKGWVKQPITGNLSIVKNLFPGCPEPDAPSDYEPFDPDGLTEYLPLPPDTTSR